MFCVYWTVPPVPVKSIFWIGPAVVEVGKVISPRRAAPHTLNILFVIWAPLDSDFFLAVLTDVQSQSPNARSRGVRPSAFWTGRRPVDNYPRGVSSVW